MKPLHDGSKSPEKAKTIVKCGKEGRFPKGAAETLRSYFDHGKLIYPAALQKKILATETVRCCLAFLNLFLNYSLFQNRLKTFALGMHGGTNQHLVRESAPTLSEAGGQKYPRYLHKT